MDFLGVIGWTTFGVFLYLVYVFTFPAYYRVMNDDPSCAGPGREAGRRYVALKED